MRPPVLVGLLVATLLGGLLVVKHGPTSAELDRVYTLAMSPTMQSVAELQWASALLRSHGRSGQADMVDMKWQAVKARAPALAASSVPAAGFLTGHHYTGRAQLSWLENLVVGTSDIARGVEKATGVPVTVESLGSGAYLVSGVWTNAPTPYPVPLPDRVVWIRDDTTGEIIQ